MSDQPRSEKPKTVTVRVHSERRELWQAAARFAGAPSLPRWLASLADAEHQRLAADLPTDSGDRRAEFLASLAPKIPEDWEVKGGLRETVAAHLGREQLGVMSLLAAFFYGPETGLRPRPPLGKFVVLDMEAVALDLQHCAAAAAEIYRYHLEEREQMGVEPAWDVLDSARLAAGMATRAATLIREVVQKAGQNIEKRLRPGADRDVN